jgi:hypothetical protein
MSGIVKTFFGDLALPASIHDLMVLWSWPTRSETTRKAEWSRSCLTPLDGPYVIRLELVHQRY